MKCEKGNKMLPHKHHVW